MAEDSTSANPNTYRFTSNMRNKWQRLNRSHFESLHRKLRLNAYIGQQRADEQLCKELHAKFAKDGADPVLIVGNWGAPMSKYHAPIKGVGMRRMLRRHGFEVFLINEHNTSSICPACCTEVL
ncbi:hypothetical protein EV175_004393 [Coemansia sp. RSA 1933]|nr:hypothetical protein EV175_004393 [Coemansia sp. RSA 1933]